MSWVHTREVGVLAAEQLLERPAVDGPCVSRAPSASSARAWSGLAYVTPCCGFPSQGDHFALDSAAIGFHTLLTSDTISALPLWKPLIRVILL